MQKITIHWTAGSYASRETNHYHFTVDQNGGINLGRDPEVNLSTRDGDYVAHCGGGNTGNIGVAMMGMGKSKEKPKGFYKRPDGTYDCGSYPLTAKQCEATWALVARLCKQYKIPVTPDTVFTHYEFGKKHPNTTSRGKIDIIHLPHVPHLQAHEVGDYMRQKVQWYLNKLEDTP